MKKVLKFTAIFLCLALVFVAACQKSEEKAAEKAMEKAIEKDTGEKAKVDIKKDKVVVEQKEGKAEFAREGSLDLPDNFPTDVYIYPGAKILMSFSDKNGITVTLATDDNLPDVAGKYEEEMSKKGWNQETTMKMQQIQIYTYKKGNQNVTIQIMPGSSQMAPGAEKAKTIIGIVAQMES